MGCGNSSKPGANESAVVGKNNITPPATMVKSKPVVADIKKPVVADIKKPVVADIKKPVVAEVKKPIVAEVAKPVVDMKSEVKIKEFRDLKSYKAEMVEWKVGGKSTVDKSKFYTYECDECEALKGPDPYRLEARFKNAKDKLGFIVKEVGCLQTLAFYNEIFGMFKFGLLDEKIYKDFQKAFETASLLDVVDEIDMKDRTFKCDVVNQGIQIGGWCKKGEVWVRDGLGIEANINGTFYLAYYKQGRRVGKCVYFCKDHVEVYCLDADGKYDGKHTTTWIHTGKVKECMYDHGKWIQPKK
jgi:hypothetical protein